MFSRKLALLAAGYIAGNVVSSLYSSKKGKDLKKTLDKAKESGDNEKSIIINNIIDTHKNFFEDIKGLLSEENQKILESKKIDVLKIVDDYKNQGDKLMKEFGGKGAVLGRRLQKLYDEKKGDIKKHLDEVSPEEFHKVSDKLLTYFDGFMGKLKTEAPVKKSVARKKTPATKRKIPVSKAKKTTAAKKKAIK